MVRGSLGGPSPGSDMITYFSLIFACCTHCMMAYGLHSTRALEDRVLQI